MTIVIVGGTAKRSLPPSFEDDVVLDFFETPGCNVMPAELRCDAHIVQTRR